MKLEQIWRYPVKSLSGAALTRTVLNPGQGLPHDRRWALARAGSDALGDPGWHAKAHFLVLVREHGLAELNCHFEELTGRFSLKGPDGLHAEGNLLSDEGRAAIAGGIAKHLGLSTDETPIMVQAQDIGYFDTTKGPVSILNMASHRALETALGQPLSHKRFRMNFLIEDAEAWAETQWAGKRVKIGKAVLRISQDTGRCKATHVNPQTGSIDVKVMHALKEHFGHTNMGVYAIVEEGGPVHAGDPVQLLD